MKFSTTTLGIAASFSLLSSNSVLAFAPAHQQQQSHSSIPRFAMMETEEKKEVKSTMENIDPNAEGLPWWWEYIWKLDIMKKGEPGTDCTFGDSANVLRTNIEQIYGGYPSLDGCPLAEGDIADIADGTQFIGLQKYYRDNGSPYKLCFGPKSFLVISDPYKRSIF